MAAPAKKNREFTARKQYIVAFWVTLAIAISLITIGFFTPPKAQVDGSVLESVGLIFLWPALSFGNKALEEGKIARIQRGSTTISVGEVNAEFEAPGEAYEDINETEEA